MPKNRSLVSYNYAARKTNTIGAIVHNLDSYFVTSALKGMETVMEEAGYELIITHSQESVEKEIAHAQLLLDRRVEGLIASLSVETEQLSHFTPFKRRGIPVVFFDRVEKTGDNDKVVIDNAQSGFLATEHLIRQGCKRIGFVSASLNSHVYAQRYKGFREALKAYKLPFDESFLLIDEIGIDGGADAAKKIKQMPTRPDGLFVTSDLMAAMCMHELKEAGINVPEDIAIVGFNNDPVGRLITPSLTTIDYPGVEIGKAAATSLLNQLHHSVPAGRRTTAVISSGLIVRNSSLKNRTAL